jgi:hypothetical protein
MDSRRVEYLDRSEGQRVRNRRAPGGACSGRCDVVGGFRIGRGVDDAPQAETVAVELARRCCGVQVMDSHPLWRPSTVSVVLDAALVAMALGVFLRFASLVGAASVISVSVLVGAASVISVSVSGSRPQRRARPFTAVCTYDSALSFSVISFLFLLHVNQHILFPTER